MKPQRGRVCVDTHDRHHGHDSPLIGKEVAITGRGKITDTSNAHGLCYEVELPQYDYVVPRRVWLEAHEVRILGSSDEAQEA
jgi:hypothetical protein